MEKKKIKGVLMALLLCVFMSGCSENQLNGSRVKNPDAYLLTFSYMSQKDEHTLQLVQGDTLCVEYEIEKGDIDVTVGIDGEEPIYKGNDIETGTFELAIQEDGDYIITVDAKRAAGTINFVAAKSEQTEENLEASEQETIDTGEQEDSTGMLSLEMPILDEINQNVSLGTTGAYMTAVQEAVNMLDWGTNTGLDPQEIKEATVAWLMDKGNDEQVAFAQKLTQVDDAYHKLLKPDAKELLESAGCENAAYPWSDVPVEAIEAVMDAVGLRPYEENSAETEDWKAAFEKSLLENYEVTVDHYEDLGDGVFQVYVVIDGQTVPYVTVDSKTGDYHG